MRVRSASGEDRTPEGSAALVASQERAHPSEGREEQKHERLGLHQVGDHERPSKPLSACWSDWGRSVMPAFSNTFTSAEGRTRGVWSMYS